MGVASFTKRRMNRFKEYFDNPPPPITEVAK